MVERATNTVVFETYMEKLLAPSLRAGQIVIADNLSAHKSQRSRGLVEARGRGCGSCLPTLPTSRQLRTPRKSCLRKAAARTKEALEAAMAEALEAITPEDAVDYFHHCGYHFQTQPL